MVILGCTWTPEVQNLCEWQDLDDIREDHEKSVAEIGEQYKGKLIVEYQKYDNLEEMYNNIKKNYEQKMIDVDKSTKEQLDGMKLEFDKVVKIVVYCVP